MATIQDDRTTEEKVTHRFAWLGTDSFLSGWGGAEGGNSYAAWAFEDGNQNTAEASVRGRVDMKRVRLVDLDDYRPGQSCAHFHVYTFKPEIHNDLRPVSYTG